MNDKIEILRYHKDGKDEGYIGLIIHNDMELARFNPKLGRIDLSVLNPFAGKEADLYYINVDTKEEVCHRILIERLENDPKQGWVLYLKYVKKDEGEGENDSSEN